MTIANFIFSVVAGCGGADRRPHEGERGPPVTKDDIMLELAIMMHVEPGDDTDDPGFHTRDIASGMGMSVQQVSYHLAEMRRRGRVEKSAMGDRWRPS
jgi:hypothetical protein